MITDRRVSALVAVVKFLAGVLFKGAPRMQCRGHRDLVVKFAKRLVGRERSQCPVVAGMDCGAAPPMTGEGTFTPFDQAAYVEWLGRRTASRAWCS